MTFDGEHEAREFIYADQIPKRVTNVPRQLMWSFRGTLVRDVNDPKNCRFEYTPGPNGDAVSCQHLLEREGGGLGLFEAIVVLNNGCVYHWLR